MTVKITMRVFVSLIAVFLSLVVSLCFAGTNEEGIKFLEENGKKTGVVTLPSGLQYKVLQQGSGKYHPRTDTPCLCHYEGKLLDGTIFDSSYERGSPTTFAPNQVIKGWTEAMQLMVQGDKWELYVLGSSSTWRFVWIVVVTTRLTPYPGSRSLAGTYRRIWVMEIVDRLPRFQLRRCWCSKWKL